MFTDIPQTVVVFWSVDPSLSQGEPEFLVRQRKKWHMASQQSWYPLRLGWEEVEAGVRRQPFPLLDSARMYAQAGVSLYFCLCGVGSDTSKIVVS